MKMFIFFISIFTAISAMAQVKIEGRLYSPSNCNYEYSTLGDFKLSYESSNIKPIKSVAFIVGFHNTWGPHDWASLQNIQAVKTSATRWVAGLEAVSVSERGSFAFDAVEWIVQIENMDGTKMWSKPTDENSFFKAQFPTDLSCSRGDYQNLVIVK